MSDASARERVAAAVREALAGRCEVAPGTPVVAACSGGADSVALVDALAGVAGTWPLMGVVFVDHGLRDVAAEREAAAEAADRAGVALDVRRITVPAEGNRQAAARRGRYGVLLEAAPAGAVVATGHTRTDQAETVVQRLLRGAGLRGLSGVHAREGRVVRPLLGVSRAETRALGLPFADDPTNASGSYQRNRVRQRVLPALVAEAPDAEAQLARAATQAADELALLDALLARLPLEEADLAGTDPELAALVVRWRLRTELPDLPPPGRAAVSALARRLTAGREGAVDLGGGARGARRGGRLVLSRRADPRTVLVAPSPGSYRLPGLRLELAERPWPRGDDAQIVTHRDTWLDADRVVWPLTLQPLPTRASLAGPGRAWQLLDGAGRSLWTPGRPSPSPPGGPRGERALHVRMLPDR